MRRLKEETAGPEACGRRKRQTTYITKKGEVVDHAVIYGSKEVEVLSAFNVSLVCLCWEENVIIPYFSLVLVKCSCGIKPSTLHLLHFCHSVPACANINQALGRPTWQSSTRTEQISDRAVDGDRQICTHTAGKIVKTIFRVSKTVICSITTKLPNEFLCHFCVSSTFCDSLCCRNGACHLGRAARGTWTGDIC